jgi:hypothetical protein
MFHQIRSLKPFPGLARAQTASAQRAHCLCSCQKIVLDIYQPAALALDAELNGIFYGLR